MTAIIIPFPGWGQLLAIYKFGHVLQNAGYKVLIATSEEYRQSITNNGFECVTYLLNTNAERPRGYINKLKLFYGRMKERDQLIDDMISKIIEESAPDIAFVDSGLSRIAFPFFKRKVKVMLFSTSLSGDQTMCNPPFSSHVIPSFSKSNAIYIDIIWKIWYLRKWFFFLKTEVLSLGHFDYYLNRICLKYKIDRKMLDKKRVWHIGFRHIPEIFFYASEFDFAPNTKANKFYIGPMMDLRRNEQDFNTDFNWDAITIREFVVCCSLGTQARYYNRNIDEFYKKVVEAFSNRSNCTLIMAVGKGSALYEMKLPDNVFIFDTIPQIEVLQKSHLLINHAGIGSVKECILLGVPMLAYPLDDRIDQNGTAARIQHFKIGLRGNCKTETAGRIAEKVDILLGNPEFKINVCKWKEIFESAERNNNIIHIIEKYRYAGRKETSA